MIVSFSKLVLSGEKRKNVLRLKKKIKTDICLWFIIGFFLSFFLPFFAPNQGCETAFWKVFPLHNCFSKHSRHLQTYHDISNKLALCSSLFKKQVKKMKEAKMKWNAIYHYSNNLKLMFSTLKSSTEYYQDILILMMQVTICNMELQILNIIHLWKRG